MQSFGDCGDRKENSVGQCVGIKFDLINLYIKIMQNVYFDVAKYELKAIGIMVSRHR